MGKLTFSTHHFCTLCCSFSARKYGPLRSERTQFKNVQPDDLTVANARFCFSNGRVSETNLNECPHIKSGGQPVSSIDVYVQPFVL